MGHGPAEVAERDWNTGPRSSSLPGMSARGRKDLPARPRRSSGPEPQTVRFRHEDAVWLVIVARRELQDPYASGIRFLSTVSASCTSTG